MRLGRWDVETLLDEMPESAFQGWLDYWSIEPWGEDRADYRAGMIASTMANLWSKGRRFKPTDFMVHWDKPPGKQMDEGDMKAAVRAYKKAAGV